MKVCGKCKEKVMVSFHSGAYFNHLDFIVRNIPFIFTTILI